MDLSAIVLGVFNGAELQAMVNFSDSNTYKRKGFRPNNCYASEICEIETTFSKVDSILEVVSKINLEKWNFDIQGEVKAPSLHRYELGKSLPMNNLSYQTHRNVENEGFLWHYDSIEVGSKITIISKISEEGSIKLLYINDQVSTYSDTFGSALAIPSFVPYTIINTDGKGIYLFYYIK